MKHGSNARHLRLVEGSGRRASRAAPPPPPEPPLDATAAGMGDAGPARAPRKHQDLAGLTDGQLVRIALGARGLATGGEVALEALYRRHVAFALQLATRIEGSTRDVEDVVHDAFIKAFSRIADLTD